MTDDRKPDASPATSEGTSGGTPPGATTGGAPPIPMTPIPGRVGGSDPDRRPDPVEDIRKGLGLLLRAAKSAIDSLPKEKVEEVVLSGAREVGRAIENVTQTLDKQFLNRDKAAGTGHSEDRTSNDQPPSTQPSSDESDKTDAKPEGAKAEDGKAEDRTSATRPADEAEKPGGPRVG
jgi:hypothetical protein